MIRRPPRSTLFPTRRSSDLFLTDADALRAELERMPVEVLTAEERTVFDRISTQWDTFFGLDGQAAALYAQDTARSEEHTSEVQSRQYHVCRLLLEQKKKSLA